MPKNHIVPKADKNYAELLTELKHKVQSARIRACRTANKELIQLYWDIGQTIVQRQEKYGWGKSVVEQLSKDLQKEFGTTHGFSTQNLWYMRQFYQEYKAAPQNLQQLVGEIPWGQNILIMSKLKDSEAREYYLKATSELGWSRNVLGLQIEGQAYERHRLVSMASQKYSIFGHNNAAPCSLAFLLIT